MTTLTHGMFGTKVYSTWCKIKGRCLNPKDKSYSLYGGRGISIANEWKENFSAFYAHIGDPPTSAHSIDRIDNEKGYQPGNVRWATWKEQSLNKRNNVIITFRGKSQPRSAWAEEIGISGELLYKRLKTGWPLHRALSGLEMPQRRNNQRSRA